MSKLKRPPVFREDGTIEIRLTRGYVAVIDAVDAEQAKLNWFAARGGGDLFYAARGLLLGKKTIYLHRELLGVEGKVQVDHKDGDGLNNRRSNLRVADDSINKRNRGLQRNNTSGYRGVYFLKSHKKWVARLCRKKLGYFSTPEEANEARLKAEVEMWGVHPRRAVAHASTSD